MSSIINSCCCVVFLTSWRWVVSVRDKPSAFRLNRCTCICMYKKMARCLYAYVALTVLKLYDRDWLHHCLFSTICLFILGLLCVWKSLSFCRGLLWISSEWMYVKCLPMLLIILRFRRKCCKDCVVCCIFCWTRRSREAGRRRAEWKKAWREAESQSTRGTASSYSQ